MFSITSRTFTENSCLRLTFTLTIKRMLNKIFLLALAIGSIIMCALTYLVYSQLKHIGFASTQIAADYKIYENYFLEFLWFSSAVFLILGNIILWSKRKSWGVWATLLYFGLFFLLQGWWLGNEFYAYKVANNLPVGGFYGGGLFSTIIVVVAAVGIFFDQFLVLRLRDRLYEVQDVKHASDELPPKNIPDIAPEK